MDAPGPFLTAPAAGPADQGPRVEGFLDRAAATIDGWAWIGSAPDRRLTVDLLVESVRWPDGGGRPMTDPEGPSFRLRTVADCPRDDLRAAGIGDGEHGFSVATPDPLLDRPFRVEALVADPPGARLAGSPRCRYLRLPPHLIRPLGAGVADIEAFLAWRRAMHALDHQPFDPVAATADLYPCLTTADQVALVVDTGGHLLGLCQLHPGWPAVPEAGEIALGIEIHPDVRGFGLGRRLMAAAQDWADHHRRRIVLAVSPRNQRAYKLYLALGYRLVGQSVLRATGEPHQVMAAPERPPPAGPGPITRTFAF